MPHRIVPRGPRLLLQAPQRKRPGHPIVAKAMLVVNGESLRGFAGNARRTSRQIDQPLPAFRGLFKPPAAPLSDCQCPQCRHMDPSARPDVVRGGAAEEYGVAVRFDRSILAPATFVHLTQRQRLPPIVCSRASQIDELQESRSEHSQ